jgi:hypothetical protein
VVASFGARVIRLVGRTAGGQLNCSYAGITKLKIAIPSDEVRS